MTDFTLMSTGPLDFKNFMVSRGLVAASEDEPPPLQGVEYTLNPVPNPIINQLAVGVPGEPGYTPAVPDPRFVNLLRLTGESQEKVDEIVTYVQDNSFPVHIHGADGTVYESLKLDTENIWWILPESQAPFGTWQ